MSRLELGGRGNGALQSHKVLPLLRQITDHDQYVDNQEALTQQKEQEKKNIPGYNKPCYYKGEYGNKPCDLEPMLRIYPVQNLYNLSNMATVAEVIDRCTFSDFCGVDSSNQVPDVDTFDCFDGWLLSFFLDRPYCAVLPLFFLQNTTKGRLSTTLLLWNSHRYTFLQCSKPS